MNRLARIAVAFLVAGATAHAASITATPSPLAFGGAQLGSPVQRDLTLANTSNQKYNVTGATVTVDAAEYSLVSPPPFPIGLTGGVSFALTVQFQPSQPGQRMGTLVITTDDPQANTITVPLTGCSGPAAIALDVNSLIFASTNLGASATPDPITISNAGCADLDVNAITLGGANPGDFTLNPMNAIGAIPTGASRKFTVGFAPTLVGQRSATVTIASNDPNVPSKSLSVFGNGTTSMLTLAPQALAFGDAHFGARSATQNLTVGNVGSGTLHVMGVTFSGGNAMAFLQSGGPAPPFTVGANAQVQLGVACRPDTLGPLAATVTVTTDVGQAQAQLTCNGIAPKVAVTPNAVDFGQVDLGATAKPLPVTVANMGTDDLHVTFVGFTGADAGDFASMDLPQMPLAVAAGGSATFHVTFAPSAHRAETASLQLMTDDPMAATVMVPLAGAGVQLGLGVSVMTLDFGAVPLGATSAAKPVKIQNTGDLPLTVDSLTLAGGGAANFTVDNRGPITLASG